MGMTKDQTKLLKQAESAGCQIRRTKKGHYFVKTPSGKSILVGGGNARGTKNARARLRREGLDI